MRIYYRLSFRLSPFHQNKILTRRSDIGAETPEWDWIKGAVEILPLGSHNSHEYMPFLSFLSFILVINVVVVIVVVIIASTTAERRSEAICDIWRCWIDDDDDDKTTTRTIATTTTTAKQKKNWCKNQNSKDPSRVHGSIWIRSRIGQFDSGTVLHSFYISSAVWTFYARIYEQECRSVFPTILCVLTEMRLWASF